MYSPLFTASEAAAAAPGLRPWEVDRLALRETIQPAVTLPKKRGGTLRLYSRGDVDLLRVLGALREAHIRLVDATPLLRRLQPLSDTDRRRLLQDAVAVKWPASKRHDFFASRDEVPAGAESIISLRELSS